MQTPKIGYKRFLYKCFNNKLTVVHQNDDALNFNEKITLKQPNVIKEKKNLLNEYYELNV